MSYYRHTRTSSPARRYVACTLMALAGIGIGIGGSVLWPWGFAHPPHSLPVLVPMPGALLESPGAEDMASIPADTVRHFGPPAQATGTAVFIRGHRHGHRRVYVECHPDGTLLIEGDKPATWQPDATGITDLVAQALCHAHPLLQPLDTGART